MTKEKAVEISDLFLKLLVAALIGLCAFALNSVTCGIEDLKQELKQLRVETQLTITELATLKTRFEYHEKAIR